MFDFDRLYNLCKDCGVTKSHLCALAGKNGSYISDLRRLNRNPSPATINAWATALHTTPDYLLGKTDKKNKPTSNLGDGLSEDRRYLIEAIQAMSDENVQKLRIIVEQVIAERGK